MRISGAGHEHLMVIVPMAVVFVLAVIFAGGPMPMLNSLDRYLAEFFASASEFVRSVL